MPFLTTALKAAIGLLMLDAIIEISFISSMVAWLHRRAGRDFVVAYNDSTVPLHGKPLGLLVNQGHTSNGAAGTAFVLIGLGGFLALHLRSRATFRASRASKFFYHFWLTMTVLAALLDFAALVYTFVLTHMYAGHTIDLGVAALLNNQPYPNQVPYPLDLWTPENWFTAVLQLDLVTPGDRQNLTTHLAVMKAWRWNLIPLFVFGTLVAVLAVVEGSTRRKDARERRFGGYEGASKRVSV